jgi:hypothetical protein
MAEVTTLGYAGRYEQRVSAPARAVDTASDAMLWLCFAAPASFVVTLLAVCWMSLTSF